MSMIRKVYERRIRRLRRYAAMCYAFASTLFMGGTLYVLYADRPLVSVVMVLYGGGAVFLASGFRTSSDVRDARRRLDTLLGGE